MFLLCPISKYKHTTNNSTYESEREKETIMEMEIRKRID